MRLRHSLLQAAGYLTLISVTATAHATLLSYDGFDDVLTSPLNQQNPSNSFGFNGNWSGSSTSSTNSNATVNSGNMAGLPTGFINNFGTPSGSNNITASNAPAFRELSTSYGVDTTETLYVSFLYRVDDIAVISGGGLSLFNGSTGNEIVQFGMGTGSGAAGRSLRVNMVGSSGPPSRGNEITEGPTGGFLADTTYFVVGKLEIANGNDTISITAFTGSDVIPTTESFSIVASGNTLRPGETIDTVRFNSPTGTGSSFDELRIGTTWESVTIPEPSTIVLMSVTLGALAIFRRRKS